MLVLSNEIEVSFSWDWGIRLRLSDNQPPSLRSNSCGRKPHRVNALPIGDLLKEHRDSKGSAPSHYIRPRREGK